MAVEIISWSISTKVWDRAGIELAILGSEVRHVTDCGTWPGNLKHLTQICVTDSLESNMSYIPVHR